jgi:hypothetical protein
MLLKICTPRQRGVCQEHVEFAAQGRFSLKTVILSAVFRPAKRDEASEGPMHSSPVFQLRREGSRGDDWALLSAGNAQVLRRDPFASRRDPRPQDDRQ